MLRSESRSVLSYGKNLYSKTLDSCADTGDAYARGQTLHRPLVDIGQACS